MRPRRTMPPETARVELGPPSHGAGLLLMLLGLATQAGALTYPLAGQYLGAAQGRGSEQLLLFRLPETISAQLLENQQQQQQQQLGVGQLLQPQLLAGALPQRLSQAEFVGVRAEQPEEQQQQQAEQDISLTIPLGSPSSGGAQTVLAELADQELDLQARQPQQIQLVQQLRFGGATQHAQAPQAQVLSLQQARQMLAEQSVADLLQQVGQPSAPDELMQTLAGQQQQQPQQHVSPSPSSQLAQRQQLVRQLSAGGELGQQQQRAKELVQLMVLGGADQQQPSLSSLAFEQQNAEPALWRDTQPAQYVQQQQQQQPAYSLTPQASQAGALNSSAAGELGALLARLAGSSPELLLRLRGLLRRAASQQAGVPFAAEQTPSNSSGANWLRLNEATGNRHYADHSDATADNYTTNFTSTDTNGPLEGHQTPLGGNNHMLNTFLSSQNLSSHEEINVPFIVIAMPRILSLKRNQLGTNSPKHALNSSIPSSLSSGLAQRLLSSRHFQQQQHHLAPQQLVATNLTQNNALAARSNATQQLLAAAAAAAHTHDGPQANYTAPPLEGAANASSQPFVYVASSKGAGHRSQQPLELHTSSAAPQYTMAPYARQFGLPQIATERLIRHYAQQAQYKLAHNQTEAPANRHFVQIVGRAGSAAEQEGGRRQSLGFEMQRQPQLVGEQERQEQQQVVFLNPISTQRRSSPWMAANSSGAPTSGAPYAQSSLLVRQDSLGAMVDEQLGRARPLLSASRRPAGQQQQQQQQQQSAPSVQEQPSGGAGGRLTANQMLTALMSRSAVAAQKRIAPSDESDDTMERRSSLDKQQQQQRLQARPQGGAATDPEKAPKMLLMIV